MFLFYFTLILELLECQEIHYVLWVMQKSVMDVVSPLFTRGEKEDTEKRL